MKEEYRLPERYYTLHVDVAKRQHRWDIKYLKLAQFWAELNSKDPSTKVGAVVVNFELQKEFLGYNGFPPGILDTDERLSDRELKNKLVTHAEANALRKAGDLAQRATLYVWPTFTIPAVCHECAKLAVHYKVREIVSWALPEVLTEDQQARLERWKDSIELSKTILREGGVDWRSIDIIPEF
jgi:dCMP deaminase